MDLIASVSSQKLNNFNFFIVTGIIQDDDLFFLFDTGAACPVIGVNCLFKHGGAGGAGSSYGSTLEEEIISSNRALFEKLLHEEIASQGISKRADPLKAANNQLVSTYPCMCRRVSVSNTNEREFYFDISFEDVNLPLLGESFLDDCAYSHSINGNIIINGIKEKAGREYYSGYKVLDFDKVASKYEQMKKVAP